jgi:hypothetical protein
MRSDEARESAAFARGAHPSGCFEAADESRCQVAFARKGAPNISSRTGADNVANLVCRDIPFANQRSTQPLQSTKNKPMWLVFSASPPARYSFTSRWIEEYASWRPNELLKFSVTMSSPT